MLGRRATRANRNVMKTVLITGANSGIGREAAFLEASKGNRVFLICRDKNKGENVKNEIKTAITHSNVELVIIDLGEKESIVNGVKIIKEKTHHIDVLIHNAAIFDIGQKTTKYNNESIETIFFTNFLGPVLLNNLLVDELNRSKNPRVIVISSKGLIAHPFLKINYENPEYKNVKFSVSRNYYQAKLALCVWTQYMAHKEKNTTYNAIRVPSVKVDIGRYPNISKMHKKMYEIKTINALDPKEMAETYVFVAEDDSLEGLTGKYYTETKKMVKMSAVCYKQEEWKKIQKLIGRYLGILS